MSAADGALTLMVVKVAASKVITPSEEFVFPGVRHEAPSIRVEVKDRHRCAVAAA
jgi:hypothetical protein